MVVELMCFFIHMFFVGIFNVHMWKTGLQLLQDDISTQLYKQKSAYECQYI